jgi:hypothetical protein
MRGAIPPLPKYVFMAWCLVKHRDNFNLHPFPLCSSLYLLRFLIRVLRLLLHIVFHLLLFFVPCLPFSPQTSCIRVLFSPSTVSTVTVVSWGSESDTLPIGLQNMDQSLEAATHNRCFLLDVSHLCKWNHHYLNTLMALGVIHSLWLLHCDSERGIVCWFHASSFSGQDYICIEVVEYRTYLCADSSCLYSFWQSVPRYATPTPCSAFGCLGNKHKRLALVTIAK